jgi:hypothetical protein
LLYQLGLKSLVGYRFLSARKHLTSSYKIISAENSFVAFILI